MRRLEARQAALEQVVAAEKGQQDAGQVEGQIARAKAALEVAREDLARLERLRESQPNSVGELDLRRQRVRVDIAELRVALWQDPEHIPSPIDRMQIQLDQLSDQLIDMIDQISNRRLVTPPP
jgi:multidrug resistance efflux pump